MILAHLSDLHLGYQAYESTDSGGNARERDVARAFQRAVAEIVKIEPDAIVVAGDVFDRPEPTAGALVTLARGLENLRSAIPSTPVLMVAGARDTPRSWGDPGALAALDTFSDVEAATGTPRSVRIMGGRTHVYLLPHRSVLRRPFPEVRPDPRARWNILVSHGSVGERGHGTWDGRGHEVEEGSGHGTRDGLSGSGEEGFHLRIDPSQ
ncbi:MAG: exonuclease SbcCD subunit D, partial [Longimicrobiales bacterium]